MKKLIVLAIILFILLAFGTSYAKRILKALIRDKKAVPEDTLLKKQTLVYKGKKRTYLLFIPSAYSGETPVPLVLVFHGGGGNGNGISKRARMHVIAEQEGFILAYPYGVSLTGYSKNLSWNAGSNPPQGYSEKNNIDDVGFVRELINKLGNEYKIDRKRIHACGLSKGGMFSYRLACEMSEVFASIAAVAAVMTLEKCNPDNPVPILAIHGSDDQNVPLEGGRGRHTGNGANYPSVQECVDTWVKFNRCGKGQKEKSTAKDTRCIRYSGCSDNAEVILCIIEGGGHGWPGAQPTRRQKKNDIYISPYYDASREIWNFFKGHPKL
jgi:polyhydroxybutyrate depolymerase